MTALSLGWKEINGGAFGVGNLDVKEGVAERTDELLLCFVNEDALELAFELPGDALGLGAVFEGKFFAEEEGLAHLAVAELVF